MTHSNMTIAEHGEQVKAYCAAIKKGLAKRYGPGWSVTQQHASMVWNVIIRGPKGEDGEREIPKELRPELDRLLGRPGGYYPYISINAFDLTELHAFGCRLWDQPTDAELAEAFDEEFAKLPAEERARWHPVDSPEGARLLNEASGPAHH